MSLPNIPPRLKGRSRLTDWLNKLRDVVEASRPQPSNTIQSVTTRGHVKGGDKGGSGGSGSGKPPRWA
jgi:hypothetical protein